MEPRSIIVLVYFIRDLGDQRSLCPERCKNQVISPASLTCTPCFSRDSNSSGDALFLTSSCPHQFDIAQLLPPPGTLVLFDASLQHTHFDRHSGTETAGSHIIFHLPVGCVFIHILVSQTIQNAEDGGGRAVSVIHVYVDRGAHVLRRDAQRLFDAGEDRGSTWM